MACTSPLARLLTPAGAGTPAKALGRQDQEHFEGSLHTSLLGSHYTGGPVALSTHFTNVPVARKLVRAVHPADSQGETL
ncbi:hypothetical protein SRHO_G00334730 [Serrasalmus rhombeus]